MFLLALPKKYFVNIIFLITKNYLNCTWGIIPVFNYVPFHLFLVTLLKLSKYYSKLKNYLLAQNIIVQLYSRHKQNPIFCLLFEMVCITALY